MDVGVVVALAQKEFRDALRNRWFLLFSIAFALLALSLSYLAMSGVGMGGFAGFGRTAAALVNLVLLIVPLMGLTAGAMGLVAERERGTLAALLAQPVSRGEVFWGKGLGLAVALLASLCLGFGAAGAALSIGGGGDIGAYVRLVAMAVLLAFATLALGLFVSAVARRSAAAMGVALLLWLGLVFIGDLGLMGTAVAMRLSAGQLLALALLNPLQVFKMGAILSLNATPEVLGPAGLYAADTMGLWLLPALLGILALWVILPLSAAYLAFARSEEA
ncbi:MAG: ABC transporter permease [Chloroflexi bacterium]|nr:ABC transporter permease [Chloroflexota bacterium]